jgi:translation initiation factor 2 gamma subunit (eIF-2gamma)
MVRTGDLVSKKKSKKQYKKYSIFIKGLCGGQSHILTFSRMINQHISREAWSAA